MTSAEIESTAKEAVKKEEVKTCVLTTLKSYLNRDKVYYAANILGNSGILFLAVDALLHHM